MDKIFGPGNRYVTRAKQLVGAGDVAIDLPAGPSEVLVLADDEASPEFAAADLLSQAEHGGDSQSILPAPRWIFACRVRQAVDEQLQRLERAEIIREALRTSRIIVLADRGERIAFAEAYAPEHLIVAMRDAWEAAVQVPTAGSVFVGAWSPESAGDYASGTNHTLPTGGWGRACSGVNTDAFLRKITYQELTREGGWRARPDDCPHGRGRGARSTRRSGPRPHERRCRMKPLEEPRTSLHPGAEALLHGPGRVCRRRDLGLA